MSPTSTSAIHLQKSPEDRSPLYHDTVIKSTSIPELKSGYILVKISAAAFNRRDLWIRLGQYPGIKFGSVLGADGVGIVVAAADPKDVLINKRVILAPLRGWESAPEAPESERGIGILGGGAFPPIGTFSEYVVVERDQVLEAPEHLDNVQAAAWPLGGLTAWRATMVNGGVSSGQNILITGIGGGVALTAMQLCIAKGANVYVTSGNEEKIKKAVEYGAKGGVIYKSKEWPIELATMLKKTSNPFLDCVIDSAGGNIMGAVTKVLKLGGRVVCYGMTAEPKISFSMMNVLKNQRLIGSTMGSHQDFKDATAFMSQHKIVPVVSNILNGLKSAEEGFEMMKNGTQFGKIVIDLEGKKASL